MSVAGDGSRYDASGAGGGGGGGAGSRAGSRGAPIPSGRSATSRLPRADLRDGARPPPRTPASAAQDAPRARVAATPSDGGGGGVRGTPGPTPSSPTRSRARSGGGNDRRLASGGTGFSGGGGDMATPAQLSGRSPYDDGGDGGDDDAPGAGAGAAAPRPAAAAEAMVWGTNININAVMESFRSFVLGFKSSMATIAEREAQRSKIRDDARAAAEARGEEVDESMLDVTYPPHLHPDEDASFSPEGEEPYYPQLLRSTLAAAPRHEGRGGGETIVNVGVNVQHIHCYVGPDGAEGAGAGAGAGADALIGGGIGRILAMQLVQSPNEVIPIFDLVLNDIAGKILADMEAEEAGGMGLPSDAFSALLPRVRARVFNLMFSTPMRQLDPAHIDTLVSLRGMVVRTSAIIPEMRRAYYRCFSCLASVEVEVDRGRVEDPSACANCTQRNTMALIHNRCTFIDKQQVKLQESPEHVPEGETPAQMVLFVYEEMVDTVVPGDRCTVTGVFRALGIRPSPRQRTLKSIFNTVLDVLHFGLNDKEKLETSTGADVGGGMGAGGAKGEEGEGAAGGGTPMGVPLSITAAASETPSELKARMEAMRDFVGDPSGDVAFGNLVKSLAPSIWELDDVKKGVLLQLFGGVNKDLGQEGKIRGEINVLLCGDPGTSKSQILAYVHRISPRGMYTSGTGSSAVGLTAYITKDPENRNEFVLESGALVLSDRGVCCIDEFDKMGDATRSIMHEVMEQQTVSIAKAGIIATLNARTSVLASANPKESRYNPSLSVVENLDLPPTLLSRFDLIYLILDSISQATDRSLAKHLVSLFFKPEDRAKEEALQPPFSRRSLMEYISYAKKHVQPVLSDDACTALVRGYVDMRHGNTAHGGSAAGPAGRKTIAATTRQLESLIRLSEAHARMRLCDVVEVADVDEALRLMFVSTQKAAVDPRTGTIDMNLISTGQSSMRRETLTMLTEALRELLSGRAPRERLSLGDVLKILASTNPDASEPSRVDLLAALRALADEDDAILLLGGSGKESVTITGAGLLGHGGQVDF